MSLKEVSTAADQMGKVTQQNADMVEETTAAAQTLTTETDELAKLIAIFKTRSGSSSASPRALQKTRLPMSASRPMQQMRTSGSGGAVPKAPGSEESWAEF